MIPFPNRNITEKSLVKIGWIAFSYLTFVKILSIGAAVLSVTLVGQFILIAKFDKTIIFRNSWASSCSLNFKKWKLKIWSHQSVGSASNVEYGWNWYGYRLVLRCGYGPGSRKALPVDLDYACHGVECKTTRPVSNQLFKQCQLIHDLGHYLETFILHVYESLMPGISF